MLDHTAHTAAVREAVQMARESEQEGARLLDDVRTTLEKYVVFPNQHALVGVVLWIAATHAQPAWQHATRLTVRSPEKRCGKSRLLDLIVALCHAPLVTVNATVAAIFRSIDAEDPPTLVVDEADAIFNRKASDSTEELRGLLNAGFGRGRPALRCVGPKQEPTEFETFAMVALAAIGDVIPDTILDRAIDITMRRRAPHEQVAPFRHRRDGVPLQDLRNELNVWVRSKLDRLEAAQPALPIEDRGADVWEPMVAIADAAGGRWPAMARAAAIALTGEAEAHAVDDALATRFLDDIRQVFKAAEVSELSSKELVDHLCELQDSPWQTFGLTASKLAHRLRPYGVRPQQIRVDSTDSKRQVRGYTMEALTDTFDRYLPSPGDPSQSVTPSQPQVTPPEPPERVTPQTVTRIEPVTHLTSTCDGVTAGDATTPECSRWVGVWDETPSTGPHEVPEPPTGTEPAGAPLTCDVPQVPLVPDLQGRAPCAGCGTTDTRLIPHWETDAGYCPECCRAMYPDPAP